MPHEWRMLIRTKAGIVAVLVFFAICNCVAVAQETVTPEPGPDRRFKRDVLLVVAHPDDETAIGGILARLIYDEGRSVAVVYTTNGSGGGNSHGREQGNAMGAIREIEAREALARFGIHHAWFLGGSDTPGQDVFRSLTSWGHGAVLERLVRIIRLTRPDVLITWLPAFVAGENHGDHQAAGVLATEAFELAADPTAFPAQVTPARERADIGNATEGLEPWSVSKLYYVSDADHPLALQGPPFDIRKISQAKEKSYARLAMDLHTPHLTQGDVSEVALEAQASGDDSAFLKWLGGFRLFWGRSRVGGTPEGELFEGVGTSLKMMPPVPEAGAVLPILRFGGAFEFYRLFWKKHGLRHVSTVLAPELLVSTGSYVHVPLILRNPGKKPALMALTPTVPTGWRTVSGAGTYTVAAGAELAVQTFFFASNEIQPTGQPLTWTVSFDGTASPVTIIVRTAEWTLPQ